MKYLFSRWDDARRALGRPESVLWLFDFDGTLAPIVRHPRAAVMPTATRRLLRQLAQRFPGRSGVLSGRPLRQLRRFVGIPGLIYGGTHGFEVEGPSFRRRHPASAKPNRKARELVRYLRRRSKAIPGFWIEDKKWTFCLHYRQTRSCDKALVRSLLQEARNLARGLGFKVQEGLKVVEIFSDVRWDKGQAVRWLHRRCRVQGVFYVGDDTTDETVFRNLGNNDVSVHIGRSATSQASYYLKRQSESEKLLERILKL